MAGIWAGGFVAPKPPNMSPTETEVMEGVAVGDGMGLAMGDAAGVTVGEGVGDSWANVARTANVRDRIAESSMRRRNLWPSRTTFTFSSLGYVGYTYNSSYPY